VIAKIDEQHVRMLAGAVNPSRKADFLTNIGGAKVCAGVRAIGVHRQYSCEMGQFAGKLALSVPRGTFVKAKTRLWRDGCISMT